MFSTIQPPASQPLERRLWFELELRYWLYLAGAVLSCILDLFLGPGAWWQKALCCGFLLLLAALPAARWGGVHLDSHLWWESRHYSQLFRAALRQRSATLWVLLQRQSSARTKHTPTGAVTPVGGRREALPDSPMQPWWQETDWDALDHEGGVACEADADWDAADAMQEDEEAEAYWSDQAMAIPAAGEAEQAQGWVDDWVETSQEEESPGWVDDWASQTPTCLPSRLEQGLAAERARPILWPAARLAGIAWDTATAGVYDPPALFLLDQPPRFQLRLPDAAEAKGA